MALYASYKLNKVITLSARGEYIHGDSAGSFAKNGTGYLAHGGFSDSNGNFHPGSSNAFSETLTVAFNIWDNLLTVLNIVSTILREPLRQRVATNNDTTVNGFVPNHHVQNEVSLEAVYSF